MLGVVPQIFQRMLSKDWHAVTRWGVEHGGSLIQFWAEVNASGYSSGCESGNPCFRPQNNATRGQSSKIVANSFFTDCQTPRRVVR